MRLLAMFSGVSFTEIYFLMSGEMYFIWLCEEELKG
jgi:hypothetical protein